MKYTITYRRSVEVEASSFEEANEIFENYDEQLLHEQSKYVELISVEDEDGNED